MRKILIVLWLLLPSALSAGYGEAAVSLDLCSFDSLFNETALIRMETSLQVSSEFGLSIPLTLTAERLRGGVQSWETGVFLQYHPLGWDLFLSLSLVQVALLANHPYEQGPQLRFLHEMAIGWRFSLPSSIVLKPSLIIKDPYHDLHVEYEELQSLFTRFPMVRFALFVGWTFPVRSPDEAGL